MRKAGALWSKGTRRPTTRGYGLEHVRLGGELLPDQFPRNPSDRVPPGSMVALWAALRKVTTLPLWL